MFLCRRLLFGVCIPKLQLAPTFHTILRTYSRPQLTRQASTLTSPNDKPDKPRPIEIFSQKHVALSAKKRPQRPRRSRDNPFKAYTTMHHNDRSQVARLPSQTFYRLIQEAHIDRSQTVLDYLAADVVEGFVSSDTQRRRAALYLLSLKRNNSIPLPTAVVVSLLDILHSASLLSQFKHNTVLRLIKVLAENPQPKLCEGALILALYPRFQGLLQKVEVPSGVMLVSYHPPTIVYIAFGLVHKLLRLGQDQLALDLFQILVQKNQIPPEAMQYMKRDKTKNFAFIIRSTLARSCIYWNWHTRAIALFNDIVKTPELINNTVVDLGVDILYAALELPSVGLLAQCGVLMRDMEERINDFRIPDGLVRQFYELAHKLRSGSVAESFYHHARSPEALARIRYPPPRGPSLTWFMNHLTTTSRNMHLARQLAKQVVEEFEVIPEYDRAKFIALTASHGFAVQARCLWERYAQGRGREYVVGSAATMVRVVSLFSNLVARTKTKLENMDLGEAAEAEGIELLDRSQCERDLDEFCNFASRVLQDFRAVIEPLADAEHFNLTALARGYFLLGHTAEGFDTFKVILDRKELPDIHDINVALSAMAEYSPECAAKTIERMIEKGVRPDSVTFGTVLHHSVLHGNMDLVCSLISRAQELDQGALSLKAVAALIRASVKMEGEDRGTLKANLYRALEIVRGMRNTRIVCSPNTGKYCIYASLHVDDPVMAFKFWELLVMEKTEWDDREQRFQRRLIATMIRRHCQAGWLNRDRGMLMLGTLKEKGGAEMVERL